MSKIRGTGPTAFTLPLGVADYAACERMASEVIRTFGRIHVLVNNAAFFSTLKKAAFDTTR